MTAEDRPACPVSRQVIRAWKRHAFAHPWRGDSILRDPRHTLDTSAMLDPGRPIRLMLSFDFGYHGSGWFANSEWEQNLHLSLSHPRIDAPPIVKHIPEGLVGAVETDHLGYDLETVSDDEARAWGRVVFGEDAPKAWFEPAASTFDPYRMPNVVHLRLFHDREMRPFIPKGEPYQLRPWADGSSPPKVFR